MFGEDLGGLFVGEFGDDAVGDGDERVPLELGEEFGTLGRHVRGDLSTCVMFGPGDQCDEVLFASKRYVRVL